MRVCKSSAITTIIIGHVTKDGTIAGPRVLEHMVDTVLYLEGERYFSYRILRGVKNRFGSTNEIGMFEMKEEGMCEILNPSEILISEREDNPAGSCIICSMEGTRPMLIEIQSLTAQSVFGYPKRTANGFDYNRLAVLIAVLEKRAGLHRRAGARSHAQDTGEHGPSNREMSRRPLLYARAAGDGHSTWLRPYHERYRRRADRVVRDGHALLRNP